MRLGGALPGASARPADVAELAPVFGFPSVQVAAADRVDATDPAGLEVVLPDVVPDRPALHAEQVGHLRYGQQVVSLHSGKDNEPSPSQPSYHRLIIPRPCGRILIHSYEYGGLGMDDIGQVLAAIEAVDRFWSKVEKTPTCWLWLGGKCRGYGRFAIGGGEVKAHVFSWMLANYNPVPVGRIVCHNCPGGDNPSCVNPAHLWLGTHLENSRDAVAKGRTARGDAHPSRLYPERRPRGERHWKAKLTAEQVAAIRREYIPGRHVYGRVSRAALADRYGVGRSAIDKILDGKLWVGVGT
jgi:hypothetical protein